MKTYVITLSKTFLKGHKREGEPTDFAEKLRKQKIHTIRGNYLLWSERIGEVMSGAACLSIRQWSGKPYRSKQIELAVLTNKDGVGIQFLNIHPESDFTCIIDDVGKISSERIANNDGLSLEDWKEWFRRDDLKRTMSIIHFTKFRY